VKGDKRKNAGQGKFEDKYGHCQEKNLKSAQ